MDIISGGQLSIICSVSKFPVNWSPAQFLERPLGLLGLGTRGDHTRSHGG